MSAEYNPLELMVCVGSRVLHDNATVFVGTGVPMAATMLAQKTTTPNIIAIFEEKFFSGTRAQRMCSGIQKRRWRVLLLKKYTRRLKRRK